MAAINWTNEIVAISGVFVVLGFFYAVLSKQWGRWTAGLGKRLDDQDDAIASIHEASTLTATSVARLEGYMAGRAGRDYEPQRSKR